MFKLSNIAWFVSVCLVFVFIIVSENKPYPPLKNWHLTQAEYDALPDDDKILYFRWEWQQLHYRCPHCGQEYGITPHDKRVSYYQKELMMFPYYLGEITPYDLQISEMEEESGTVFVFKCQKCGNIFSFRTIGGIGYLPILCTGVTGE